MKKAVIGRGRRAKCTMDSEDVAESEDWELNVAPKERVSSVCMQYQTVSPLLISI